MNLTNVEKVLLMEKPINIPKVPPSDPMNPIVSYIRYSSCTETVLGS